MDSKDITMVAMDHHEVAEEDIQVDITEGIRTMVVMDTLEATAHQEVVEEDHQVVVSLPDTTGILSRPSLIDEITRSLIVKDSFAYGLLAYKQLLTLMESRKFWTWTMHPLLQMNLSLSLSRTTSCTWFCYTMYGHMREKQWYRSIAINTTREAPSMI